VDAIFLDHEVNPYVCIHCGRCVEFCPHDCLELVDLPKKDGGKGGAK
jgi:formate hydrogenlyase subunit 6/NADH:ubiquinone oxidoreductase subunit I